MITFKPNFTFHTGRILPAIAFGTGTSYFERNNDVTEGNIEKATTYYEIKAEAVTRPAFKMKK